VSANPDGLVTLPSNYSVRETIDRFSDTAVQRGLIVFARIDHGANATSAGYELAPMELIILGNPKAGTPLMQERPTAGIDLPVKVLAWQDSDGKAWLTYNDARWFATRHKIGARKRGNDRPNRDGSRDDLWRCCRCLSGCSNQLVRAST
jgi:uncharacterized protein (DUF302 family)